MPKLALHFICKNESHIVERMLGSVKDLADLIVVNDTGSTDQTKELIRGFGKAYAIPTFIYERPFDDFGRSRNYALQKLREVVHQLSWDPSDVWGFWFDCDEMIFADERFRKEDLNKDLYDVVFREHRYQPMRNTFFRLSRHFRWYGPVHETLVCDEPGVTSEVIKNIYLVSEKKGHSWQGDLVEKYHGYGRLLEKFLEQEDRGAHWVFYTAQCYLVAARYCMDIPLRDQLLLKAKGYCEERVGMTGSGLEGRYTAQFQIGLIHQLIGTPWILTQQAFLEAYTLDPLRGEPFQQIIRHYMEAGEWRSAYVFSLFAVEHFSQKNPFGKRILRVEQALYNWQFLFSHYTVCLRLGRLKEATSVHDRLKEVVDLHPVYFTAEDLDLIKQQSPSVQARQYSHSHNYYSLFKRKLLSFCAIFRG